MLKISKKNLKKQNNHTIFSPSSNIIQLRFGSVLNSGNDEILNPRDQFQSLSSMIVTKDFFF